MNPSKPSVLTRRDIAARWGVQSTRTIARAEKRYGLTAVSFIGLEPVFALADVLKAEQRRIQDRRRTLARMATSKGIQAVACEVITTAEAKRRAGRAANRKGPQ